jgi:hypothetical protein
MSDKCPNADGAHDYRPVGDTRLGITPMKCANCPTACNRYE